MGLTKRLKVAMADKEIKVGAIAKKLGENPRVISVNLCNDNMRTSTIEKYANVLDCDIVLQDRKTGKIY